MRKDVECPYCEDWQEVNHDDGQGYDEDIPQEQECISCNMIFHFFTSINYYYEAKKAPCKNDKPHDYKEICGSPKGWFSNYHRCSYCDEKELKDKTLKYDNDNDIWVKK